MTPADEKELAAIHDALTTEQYIGFCKGHALMFLFRATGDANDPNYERAYFWMSQIITAQEMAESVKK